ncbi:hypothetical protein GON26_17840 [Flavobacterium sp. GA093]|uniref:DUF4145 domain-containing protein n=1 Tax=Flavobacterium hydrocarbonoxydans TaxID=2683249 RepID=A0A6I4NPC1_9FLAO|nr:DUF4145 domain-containing protein [Flavobacterium hydrocarbonoxydans]MWB96228.1 hypothetical protein [Flavobacterium hydrocarbonoxydans]
MKNFFNDHNNSCVLKEWDFENSNEITKNWNQEVPKHVENFNLYTEDRNAVIYFALFVEYHVNKMVEILMPDFDSLIGISKSPISLKINLLDSFKLLPKQIFEAARCINNIRNEFAHEINMVNLEDLNSLPNDRKKKTVDKLLYLTTEYEGDYQYEKKEDILRKRFKSICLNTISAFRVFEPSVKHLRNERIEK